MAGGGIGGAGDAAANGSHAPLGTEYTLQGVMRFLQTEWHRHERDRNAWEIERAEMKSRIARLEGEARTAKRLHDSLGKHVKILEIALTREREKIKGLSKGEKVDVRRDPRDVAREELKAMGKGLSTPSPYGPPLIPSEPPLKGVRLLEPDFNEDDPLYQGLRQDAEREKSKSYLAKCSAEITYHVMPATHPPPPELATHDLSTHAFQKQQPSQPLLQEAYIHQPQPQAPPKQQHRNLSSMREGAPNTQQPLRPAFKENPNLSRSNTQINHAALPVRDSNERRPQDQSPAPLTAIDGRKSLFEQQQQQQQQPQSPLPSPFSSEEVVESATHSYDTYAKQVPISEAEEGSSAPDDVQNEPSEGWNFDEESSKHVDPPQPDVSLPHRPDTDAFPNTNLAAPKSPPRIGPHRRKSSGASRRRSDGGNEAREMSAGQKGDATAFKVRFALRGHLDVVRSVIFTGGGSPSEPEICTAGDDGTIKRWIIPASPGNYGPQGPGAGNDLDHMSYFTHRGHSGAVTALAACPASPNFSNGGRALGDGWVFSGGQDASLKVWERGRVDPKATLDRHTDAVWALCVLPGSCGSTFGDRSSSFGGPEQILLASGGADGSILIWAVSAPPQLSSPHAGSNRGTRSSRRANSVSAGSNFPSSPQPSTATSTPFHFTLVHHIFRVDSPSPTCISPLSSRGENFVVSYTDASILVFDTCSGEEVVGMASLETYDGTRSTGVNSVVASTTGFDGTLSLDPSRGLSEEDSVVHGATGSRGGVEGVIISGYEDRYIRFFDANSGQCTYTMVAHPAAISSLSLSPDGRELVSAGHDASLRFWSLEKRSCIQEITSHRLMRGEGVCSVVWSQDGRWVVSAGGDGVVKIFTR